MTSDFHFLSSRTCVNKASLEEPFLLIRETLVWGATPEAWEPAGQNMHLCEAALGKALLFEPTACSYGTGCLLKQKDAEGTEYLVREGGTQTWAPVWYKTQ